MWRVSSGDSRVSWLPELGEIARLGFELLILTADDEWVVGGIVVKLGPPTVGVQKWGGAAVDEAAAAAAAAGCQENPAYGWGGYKP